MSYPTSTPGAGGWNPPPPVPAGGGPKLSEHVGDLVWIKVNSFEPQFLFQSGAKDTLRVDCEILAGRNEVGERFTDVLMSNVVLVKQLRDGVGREFFGRVAAGRGSNANPPIFLDPPLPGDDAIISGWLSGTARPSAPAGPSAGAGMPGQAYQTVSGQQSPGNGVPGQQQYAPAGMPPATPPPPASYGLPDEPPF